MLILIKTGIPVLISGKQADFRTKNHMKNKELKKKKLNGGISCLWVERLNIVKTSVFPNLIYRFNEIPTKLIANYSVDMDKLILRFIRKAKD